MLPAQGVNRKNLYTRMRARFPGRTKLVQVRVVPEAGQEY